MSTHRLHTALLGLSALSLVACGAGDRDKGPGLGSNSTMDLIEVTNGFGQLVPHSIQKLDAAGNPTLEVIQITSQQDLIDNLRTNALGEVNDILPVPKYPEETILPNGAPGNHFMAARFTQSIKVSSALDRSPGSIANSNLTGAVSVVAIDPVSGTSLPVQGRAFINGFTVGDSVDPATGQLPLEKWVELDDFGQPVAATPEGLGFPGTESFFAGAGQLVAPSVIVFVPDTNGDLSDHETFPTGFVIRMRITTALVAKNGKSLKRAVLGSSVVGDDFIAPEVVVTPPPIQAPAITPGNGDINVDPSTTIRIEFTEPVQPLSVGPLEGATPPNVSSAIKVRFGPDVSRTDMAFTMKPTSVYDLSVYEIIPSFNFPGAGPEFAECGTFAQVDIDVNPGLITDLARNPDPNDPENLIGNTNALSASTFFVTGEGPGIVNAPVAPDVIYIMRSGAIPGLSVIDLNGFGAGTGDPTFVEWTEGIPQYGNTNYPNNPNVRLQTGLRPPLSVGFCTIDGGSAGVFTLTRDSSLDTQVLRPPLVSDTSDVMMGHALDGTFNNAQFPFGCQAGGGDICTLSGLKIINWVQTGTNTMGPQAPGGFQTSFNVLPGQSNLISWSPHPNPPALSFPPLCVAPLILGDEPNSVDHLIPPPQGLPKPNLLVPGDPFGSPLSNPAIPPTGLLVTEQNTHFLGPTQGQVNLDQCNPYMMRQQVGHFLYVLDRQRQEVSVINSNRMTIIDRITVADPTELAMGPNLDFLAVSNQASDSVTFIDINPKSATFHQVVKVVKVGRGPRGIAWQPGNEDILVCNEVEGSLSVISAFSLEVRKTVSAQLILPFEVAVFPRQATHSFFRNVYFAYILNRNGKVAMYESGPNGVNGWGFDDIIGIAPFEFKKPKTIQVDPINLNVAAWIVHEGALDSQSKEPGPAGTGALSQLLIESANSGQIPLDSNTQPGFRSVELAVPVSIAEGDLGLTGIPVDVGFDNQRNLGGQPNVTSPFSAGAPLPANGKGLIRGPAIINNSEPQFMFAAVPNPQGGSGQVDVFELGAAGVPRRDTNAFEVGIQSVAAPNVVGVSDYWRQ